MKNVVVLTGAGMSAESGINTFRDTNGLWEGHDIMEVASTEGWYKNKALVLDFYNKRRAQLKSVKPNKGHFLLASLETNFNVYIITQNVDNLHERAKSSNILHLHGELTKVRSEVNNNYILNWKDDLTLVHKDQNGNQMRPHIVWFGEAVPLLEKAIEIVLKADFLIIVGTSLQVYPAASLMHYANIKTPVFYVDKNPAIINNLSNKLEVFNENASTGIEKVKNIILNYQ